MKKKDSKARLQVIFGLLLFALIFMAELYIMLNYPKQFVVLAVIAAADLLCLFIVVNGVMAIREMKDARREEQYESIFKSEKASYLMLKKYFEEIEDKLLYLEEASKIPTEEIINAQKGIAKVIVKRSHENTEALISSDDQIMEQISGIQKNVEGFVTIAGSFKDEILDAQKNAENVHDRTLELKMQDIITALKDMELRLNQAMNNKDQQIVVNVPPAPQAAIVQPIQTAPQTAAVQPQPSVPVPVPEMEEELKEEPIPEDLILEEPEPFIEPEDIEPEEPVGIEEPEVNISLEEENIEPLETDEKSESEAKEAVDTSPIEEPEEMPPMPDFSDPNRTMSSDEIAALFANMGSDDQPAEPESEMKEETDDSPIETPAVDTGLTEEHSDPNRTMSADEIAALFANMENNDKQPEPEPEPVPEPEAPAIDMSDPNKQLSPDEIAALFASMGA